MTQTTELLEPEMTEPRVTEVTRMMRLMRRRRSHSPTNVHFMLLCRPAGWHEGGLWWAVIIIVCIVKVVLVVLRGVRTGVPGRPVTGLHRGVVGLRSVGGRLVEVERPGLGRRGVRREVEVLRFLLPAHPHGLLGWLVRLLGLLVLRGGVVLLLLRLTLGVRRGGVNLVFAILGLVLNSLIDLSDRLILSRRSHRGRPGKDFRQFWMLDREQVVERNERNNSKHRSNLSKGTK